MLATPRGHTLIELLVAVMIIAILAAVAIPSYDAYTRRGRQEDLKARILEVAAAQERHFAARGAYTASFADLAPFGLPAGGVPTGTGWQIGDHKFLTGAVIQQETGMGYWVVGKSDVDKIPEALADCWFYTSRGISRPAGAEDDLVQIYDDATDNTKRIIAGFSPSQVCTW